MKYKVGVILNWDGYAYVSHIGNNGTYQLIFAENFIPTYYYIIISNYTGFLTDIFE